MTKLKVERFTADWCGPCKAFAPVYELVVEEHGLESHVYDIDTDEGLQVAKSYGVMAIPAVFIEGERVNWQDFKNIVETYYDNN